MKLDITKIPGYKEEMTPEEQLKLIREHDIDLSGYVKKDVADRYASEAADYKKKYNATLGEQERKSAEDADRMKAMEDELNSLRRERAISKYTADYIGLGFEKELAERVACAKGRFLIIVYREPKKDARPARPLFGGGRTGRLRRRTVAWKGTGRARMQQIALGGFPRHEPSCIMEVYCKKVWK